LGLLTKEVEIGLGVKTIKHYEDLGYEIPKYKNIKNQMVVKIGSKIIVSVNDLTESSNIKINIECDGCGEKLENIKWVDYKKHVKENDKYYCNSCASKLYGKGFQSKLKEEEIKKIINEKLGKEWTIKNIEIVKKNNYVSLIDEDNYWYDKINIQNIKNNKIPMKFYIRNKYTKRNINNWCKINDLSIRLIGTYKGANKKLKWQCLDCNNTFKRLWDSIQQGNVNCPFCNDKISYPEKFGMSLFNQLKGMYKIDYYEYQYSPDWIKPKRYDFYFELDNKGYIVEMDGKLGHGNNNPLTGQSAKESQVLDNYKNKKAMEYKIEVIRINCEKSEIEYIKNNIFKSKISELFNLSNIDWLKCHQYACNSLVKEVCDLWNSGIKNPKEIGEIIKINRTTSTKYLKQGTKLGWCNYNPVKGRRKNTSYI